MINKIDHLDKIQKRGQIQVGCKRVRTEKKLQNNEKTQSDRGIRTKKIMNEKNNTQKNSSNPKIKMLKNDGENISKKSSKRDQR